MSIQQSLFYTILYVWHTFLYRRIYVWHKFLYRKLTDINILIVEIYVRHKCQKQNLCLTYIFNELFFKTKIISSNKFKNCRLWLASRQDFTIILKKVSKIEFTIIYIDFLTYKKKSMKFKYVLTKTITNTCQQL